MIVENIYINNSFCKLSLSSFIKLIMTSVSLIVTILMLNILINLSTVYSFKTNTGGFSFLPSIEIDLIKSTASGLVVPVLSNYLRRNNHHNYYSRPTRTMIQRRFNKIVNRNIQHAFRIPSVLKALRKHGQHDDASMKTVRSFNRTSRSSSSSSNRSDISVSLL